MSGVCHNVTWKLSNSGLASNYSIGASFLKRMSRWKTCGAPRRPSEKKFLQGLIQVAVALHHFGNGNLAGARSVLRRAFRNISLYPDGFGGIDSAGLLRLGCGVAAHFG